MASESNISVYGYEASMLSGNEVSNQQVMTVPQKSEWKAMSHFSRRCMLWELPFELRKEILRHLLPATIQTRSKGVAWLRGHTAILMANKRLCSEGVRMMYGESKFVIDVTWDSITFAYQWLLANGLVPKRTLAFPGKLTERNVAYVRNVTVCVHHVDNYTGMIKHGFEGPGLREGLKLQVEKLCKTLQEVYKLSRLRIHFQNDSHTAGVDREILKPLLSLNTCVLWKQPAQSHRNSREN